MSNEDFYVDTLMRAQKWVDQTHGAFSSDQFAKELSISAWPDIRNSILQDFVAAGVIEPHGNRHGWFVKGDKLAPLMDWQGAQVDEYPIILPLGLSERVVTSPGNVIVVAGEKNAGKTIFGLRAAYMNLAVNGGAHEAVHLFDYESHPAELKARLMGIKPQFEAWSGLVPRKRSRDFHRVIEPDGLNIVDYLKVSEDFSLVGKAIGQIHDALNDGVAIVLVQKKKGEEFGRGGEFTLEEARLGVSLFADGPAKWARITKCKFPREYPNPEGMERDYEIIAGADFSTGGDWAYMTKDERQKKNEDKLLDARRVQAMEQNQARGFAG